MRAGATPARWRLAGDVFRRDAGLSRGRIGLLCLALLVIVSVPIALHPLPPLTDYVNHLARMYAIGAVGTDPDLARLYEIKWQIIPNLMMDLTVPLIQQFTNIYIAGQIYTIASFALILTGTIALNRQLFGGYSVLPLLAAPLVYNKIFLVGTMNYMSAIGLVLWSLAAWIWLRERPMAVRLAVSAVCVIALFFCHLYAAGVYGIGLLAYELYRLLTLFQRDRLQPPGSKRRTWLWRGFDFVATGLPFLPVVPLMMNSPTWGLRSEILWELDGKLDGVLYIIQLYFPKSALAVACILAVIAGWAIYRRMLRFHALGWFLLVIGAIVYMVMPRIVFDTYMADQRLPISLAFMVLACGQVELRHSLARRAFATVLVAVMALRIMEVQAAWHETARIPVAFHESMQQIERGSRILVAYADPTADDELRNQGLVHGPCLAIIERSSLVTTAFTVVGKHILRARGEYRDIVDTEDGTPPSVRQLLEIAANPDMEVDAYWGDWTADYDYVYFLFTRPGYENPDPIHLDTRYVGERFVLYRVVPPQRTPDEPSGEPETTVAGAGTQVVRVTPNVWRSGGTHRLRPRHNREN